MTVPERREVVARGTWLYDGTVVKPLFIVRQTWDAYYEEGYDDEPPHLNDEGFAFYVIYDNNASSQSRTCLSLDDAIAHAEETASGVAWQEQEPVIEMTPDEALAFLADHQPLPPDEDLTQELLERFDDAWRVLRKHPNDRTPRLLVNAFGDGDGFGVYQLAGDALQTQRRDLVIEALRDGLGSSQRGVRQWSAELAMEYPDPALDGPMLDILRPGIDDDIRYFVAAYVADRGLHVDSDFLAALMADADDELRAVLHEIEAG